MIKSKTFLFLLINAICFLLIILLKNNTDYISDTLVISSLIINIHSFCLWPLILIVLENASFSSCKNK